MKKAIAYLRVSTEGQCQYGFGLETQREMIEAYAEENNYEIIQWVEELAVSGASDDRPALNALIYDGEIGNPPYDALIVARSDRIARDINVYFGYRYMLSKKGKGIDLISTEIDFGQFGAFSSVLEAFLATMAELERKMIVSRTSMGRAVKARRGAYAGGKPPMGYKVQNGELVINPDEEQVVQRIFQLRERGLTFVEIAKMINEEGYRSRSNRPFNYSTVTNIVRNRDFYEGWYKYGEMEEAVRGQHEPLLKAK